ncbi:hypothetical protein [Alicyclobacillus fodiniaquatilis]|uniref:HTH crp-type domain-containing protein n=1 Tax=Alicyclobacillus fodiniaquatilis TaxID=1661150 RepID=A0ABW4JQM9_9BACL
MPLTRLIIAFFCASTFETVARALKQFEAAKV